jgi:methionyl-tRNA synthetase
LDALTNYISALNYPNEKDKLYNDYWPASLHLIGKDILRFHAVYWPAFLLAADIAPPRRIYGHGWILAGDEKMSKSKGNILDPIQIIDKYGLDSLRYYLAKEVSFGNDGSISQEKLESCINSDLANNYGNYCQRVISFSEKNFNLLIPEKDTFSKEDLDLLDRFKINFDILINNMDNQNLNSYMNFIVESLFSANKYFNDEEPWNKKSDIKRLNTIVYVALEVIRKISIMLYPIIPSSSLKALKIFGIEEKDIKFNTIKNHNELISNSKIKKIDILFKRIDSNHD